MHTNLIAAELCNELVEEKKGLELEVALLKDKIIELKKVLNVVLAEQADLMKDLEREETNHRMLMREYSTQAEILMKETARSEILIERLLSAGLVLDEGHESPELLPLKAPNFLLRGSSGETLGKYDSVSSPSAGLSKGDAK